MTWFRVDDSLALHTKVVAAGNAAMGLWVRAGAWSAQQLTDGFVPDHMLAPLGGSRALARRLVEAGHGDEPGLWVREEGGYRFHDWPEYQPSADEVRRDKAAKHEVKVRAGRSGGLASGVARRKHARSTSGAEEEAQVAAVAADAKQTRSETKPHPVPTEGRDRDGSSRDPSRQVTRVNSEGGWHAAVVDARRSAGADDLTGWSRQLCVNAVRHAVLEHEVSEDVAWQALVELAREPETQHPGRLTHQLQRVLAEATQPARHLAAVPDRPAWCGACDERTRLVDSDGDVHRCPTCHPLRTTA